MEKGVHIEKVNYQGWPNSYQLSNGLVDLVVTTDVGPRIIRFGFCGERNEFKEYAGMLGQKAGDEWRIYGGHRLWHAPEVIPRTYFPDNSPVALEQHADWVRVIQPAETTTGIRKEMDIRLAAGSARAEVMHRLYNCGPWTVELAPWALSVMAPGGRAIIPLPPRGAHSQFLLPLSSLALYAYTDMSDPRWTWGRKYVMLRQDSAAASPQKLGLSVPDGWAAYARDGRLFVVRFAYLAGASYPDMGSSVETFTNAEMLELETVGPLVRLLPGATVEHLERWYLFHDVPEPGDDEDVDRDLLPLVASSAAE